MRVVVLGLGISGRAVVDHFLQKGDKVIGVDKSVTAYQDITMIHDSTLPALADANLVVKSPGIPSSHPWVEAADRLQIRVMGEIDLALSLLQHTGKRILGITGSNGKTTTSLLAAHLLTCSGVKALAVGNIGKPLLAYVDSDVEVLVVELSSFQLERIHAGAFLDGALILNITPNHLDRHHSFTEYMEAKLRISHCLKPGAPLYIGQQLTTLDHPFLKNCTPVQEKVETIWYLRYRDILYPHDLENLAAAQALTSVSCAVLQQGIATFVRPPHRLEVVAERGGVHYVNDSKATSVDAVIKAVEALSPPIILLAGGVDKGGDFRSWIDPFTNKVIRIFAMGPAATRIQRELTPLFPVEIIASVPDGVERASRLAVPGATVLLSPGCSSYDQFTDYQHRGEVFRYAAMSNHM